MCSYYFCPPPPFFLFFSLSHSLLLHSTVICEQRPNCTGVVEPFSSLTTQPSVGRKTAPSFTASGLRYTINATLNATVRIRFAHICWTELQNPRRRRRRRRRNKADEERSVSENSNSRRGQQQKKNIKSMLSAQTQETPRLSRYRPVI